MPDDVDADNADSDLYPFTKSWDSNSWAPVTLSLVVEVGTTW